LEQTSNTDKKFFPPPRTNTSRNSSEYITWIFAKMHLASADSQIHEMISHLGTTHLALEPICIATFRIFGEDHPLFRLLKPHTRQTISINELGRRTLLNKGGFFDTITSLGMVGTLRLIEEAWKTYNYSQRAFPILCESRGFPEVPREKIATYQDILPGYLYRDYGYMIWNALKSYVTEVIENNFVSDNDVAKDVLIQRWAYEISHPDFGNLPGFPSKILTKQHLIDVCTNFINTASAQHSAVNFGQFDYYGFIPMRPLSLFRPMPEDTTHLNWTYVLDALPDVVRTIKQMIITYILSTTPSIVYLQDQKAKTYLGNTLSEALDLTESFWKPEFTNEWKKLDEALRQATEYMISYNLIHGYSYHYLYPSDIALSVAI